MKKLLKGIVALFLALLARAVVHRYRPHIVMVTGSVGKTSTKDAVAAVLSARFFVRKSEKSFNSEFGVPFSILGVENPWNNPFAWFLLFRRALALLLLPNHYPSTLVLEVGADKPGDLTRILRIVKPDVVVVTQLPKVPVHVEAYASPEAVRDEEFSPAYALPAAAPLIISSDDAYAVEHAKRTPARVFSYGTATDATVRLAPAHFLEEQGRVVGMSATAVVGDERVELAVRGSVGATQVFSSAAALAVAVALNIPLEDALVALEEYTPPSGRGRLLRGKSDSLIIDDSYNSSPVAVEQALATLQSFPHASRRVAILGDMLELGRYSVQEHERIGRLACAAADVVIAIGIRARAFVSAPGKAEVQMFDNSSAAAFALASLPRPGDVILIKGSQSIRMEHIVQALLADRADVCQLVRQERRWKRR